jgi:cell division protein FtsI/penicillin-binding protein 2
MKKDYFKNRIRFISVVVFFVGALFCVKLFWLQVVHGEMYSKEANRQYITPQGSQFDRGSIFFKKKNGELVSGASLLHGFTVAINPKLIENPEQAFADLSKIIPLDQETFSRQVAKKDDPL